MARNVTLLQLRTDIQFQVDQVIGSSGHVQTTNVNRLINQSIQRFRERVSSEGMTRYLVSTTGTLTTGTTSPYPFSVLDLSSLSPALVRTYGVDLTVNTCVKTLSHIPFTERANYGGTTTTSEPQAWSHFQGSKIALSPAPDQAYTYVVWYLPVLSDLASDGDTFDGVAGWEDFIVWDVVCRLIIRDQYAEAYQMASEYRDGIWKDILRGAQRVSASGGATIGRDAFGGRVQALRSPFSPGSPGTGGGPISVPYGSVGTLQMAAMTGPAVIGRVPASLGQPDYLGPTQLAQVIPLFAGLAGGLVPTGTGSTTTFLRNDGSWATPPGGGATTLPGGPTGSVQYNGGTGFGGASGFLYDGTSLTRYGNFAIPTGTIGFGATGLATPAQGFITFPHGGMNVIGTVTADVTNNVAILRWGGAGVRDNVVILGGNVNIGTEMRAATGGDHRWLTNNVLRGQIDGTQLRLVSGMDLGLAKLSFPTAVGEKLGTWTASGFANQATGIHVVGSGTAFAFGSNPSTAGTIRFGNSDSLQFRNVAGSGNLFLAGGASDNAAYFGDPANAFTYLRSGGTVNVRAGGTSIDTHSFGLTSYTMGSGVHLDVGINGYLGFGSGVSTQGFVRYAANSGDLLSARNYDNTGNQTIVSIAGNSTFTDLHVGDSGNKGTNSNYYSAKAQHLFFLNNGGAQDSKVVINNTGLTMGSGTTIDNAWTINGGNGPTGLSITNVGAITGRDGYARAVDWVEAVRGTPLTDADATKTVGLGNRYTMPSGVLSTTRTFTLIPTGATVGEVVSFERLDTSANTMVVANGGPGGSGTIYTFPASQKRAADFIFASATSWALAGHVRIS